VIGELLDDLNAMLLGPFANLVALDGNRVLLPILGRMPIVRDGADLGWPVTVSLFYFPPSHIVLLHA
jgi:hypothetical protein